MGKNIRNLFLLSIILESVLGGSLKGEFVVTLKKDQINSVLTRADLGLMAVIPDSSGRVTIKTVCNELSLKPCSYDRTTVQIHGIVSNKRDKKITLLKSYTPVQLQKEMGLGLLVFSYDKAPDECVFFICATAEDVLTKEIIQINVHDFLSCDFGVVRYDECNQALDLFGFSGKEEKLRQEKLSTVGFAKQLFSERKGHIIGLSVMSVVVAIPFFQKAYGFFLMEKKIKKPALVCPEHFITSYKNCSYNAVMESTAQMYTALQKFSPRETEVRVTDCEEIKCALNSERGAITCAAPRSLSPTDKRLTKKEIQILGQRMEHYFKCRGLRFI